MCRESDGCEIQCDNVEFDIVCDTDNLVYVIVLSLLCDIICGYVVYFDRCNYSIIWIYAFMWERSSYFLPWPNSSVRARVRQMAQLHKQTNQCAQQSVWVIFSNPNVFFVLRQHTKRTLVFSTVVNVIQSFIS